ncbi:MAG TPA: glycosyltransferase family 39 protein [Solirubrobacteraceae bacterium]|nr:glycosyltransferase family 39 protein [Solirubrobacteraceae bacterium]
MSAVTATATHPRAGARRPPAWWPLAALTLLAAALRFATLGEQSFWYDEAFTPVHVLHSGLGATLHAVVHTENTPPLWYMVAWLDVRVFGDGALALRFPSALAGVATVPVAWAIAERLAGRSIEGRPAIGRRAAVIVAAIVAVNPLLVWYSQEARAYALFVLLAALAMLCFVRLLQAPTRGRLAAFAAAGALALLTHYFAVFLLVPMVVWLLWDGRTRRAALPALGAIAVVGLALLPLISAQGGHGTQWIGRWALSSRLEAIPRYYLTGYSGAPLGHGVELLVALPIMIGSAFGAWRLYASHDASHAPGSLPQLRRGASIAFTIAAFGALAPIVLVAFGVDYLAPRNLVAAMIPVSVLIAILLIAVDAEPPRAPVAGLGVALAAVITLAFLALSIDVSLSPRLQRGNWRGLAHVIERGGGEVAGARSSGGELAITTVELGAAPLEYYMSHLRLHNLAPGERVRLSEIDETGYAPLRASAGRRPSQGFRLVERREIDGLIVYRFVSSVPRFVSEAELRRHVITLAHPEVLVPAGARVTIASAGVQ